MYVCIYIYNIYIYIYIYGKASAKKAKYSIQYLFIKHIIKWLSNLYTFSQKQSFYQENFKNKSNISKHEWQDILNLKRIRT